MSKRATKEAGAQTTMTRSSAGLVHGFLASGSKIPSSIVSEENSRWEFFVSF